MSERISKSPFLHRDGTSQAGRIQLALDPDYVSVDEHSVKDLLTFAREYASELRYYDGYNREVGDWGAFLDPEMDIDQIVAFMDEPAKFTPKEAPRFYRPHFVLFLTFLKLLHHAQDHLNTFTRRHLDFYYQKVLCMRKKAAVPDKVNILFEPASDVSQILLPAGTLLNAGPDSQGQDRIYRTDRDIIVNHAQIARKSSVFVHKRITGIREAHERETDPREGFMEMLKIALGDPLPGDPLPQYETGKQVDYNYLISLRDLVDFVDTGIFMDFSKFRTLMRLKSQRDKTEFDWKIINGYLQEVGRNKRKDPNFELSPTDIRDFEGNLELALKGLPIYPSLTDGGAIENLDDYYEHFCAIERYFFMFAEDFSYIMSVAEKQNLTSGEWDKVYNILADAHKEKVYEGRRQQLRNNYDQDKKGFDAMIRFALGEDLIQEGLLPLQQLKEFVTNSSDIGFLEDVKLKLEEDSDQVDWDRVYRIVEIAQRIREKYPEPVACKEEWHNLYPSEDATALSVAFGIEEDKKQSRWKTFGQPPSEAKEDGTQPLPFGWAISSPLLALSEGKREIILTLEFSSDSFSKDGNGEKKIESLLNVNSFIIEISTEKGWIAPVPINVDSGANSSLTGISNEKPDKKLKTFMFMLTVGPDIDAIAPLPKEKAQIDTRWPVLKIMPRQQIWDEEIEKFTCPYPYLKDLVLVRTHLHVEVEGLTNLQIQNDETVLDAKKPFEPFGLNPSVGSRFFLGHPELVYKRLDSLIFNIDWMGVPNNLKTHYTNYGLDWSKHNFTICISLIDRHVKRILSEAALLFSDLTAAGDRQTIEIPKKTSEGTTDLATELKTIDPDYDYKRIFETFNGEDLLTWNRYLQWVLNDLDFQHGAYATVAAQRSIEMAADIVNDVPTTVDPVNYQVNPPYTPKIKSLTLDYTSSEEIILKEYQSGSQIDSIFHIHPFGYNEIQPDGSLGGCFFFPQYDNEGELYIGIKDVHPRQNVSVLFQMAEGSADPDLEPVPIQWSYLSDNRWISLHEGNILFDSTRGLINSGIIIFKLEPVKPSTLLPKDLYWIRAVVSQDSTSVCDTIAIHTQAVTATFVDNNNAPYHYRSPLPAGTVTNLAESMPEIVSVSQPYTSYGAKMEEQDNIFYTRVSERLRHKNRALTIWDYEHMVLERFPQVYKAKCLPVNMKDHSKVPGKVEIIIIPDIRDRLPFDPFEPKASAELIADIESYLSDKIPAYATVKARNAHYVAVKVRVGVRFRQGVDEGYYKTRLNEELNRFLSPWAYEEGKDIVIGGKIYANNIINFIDERKYVDYVAKIKLFSNEDGKTFKLVQPSELQGYFVTTERPDGVLVAAQQHEIDIISDVGYEQEEFTGINYMKIELDFIIG